MKVKLFITILVVNFFIGNAQQRFATKTGTIYFEASTANFEPVAARNTSTSAILKNDGNLAILALIKGFRFKKSLMEDHFNEKFMESDTYPKAKFVGKILNFNYADLPTESREFVVKGNLIIHGETKAVETRVILKREGNGVNLKAKFNVAVADFNIAVKSKIAKKIAKIVIIDVNLDLK